MPFTIIRQDITKMHVDAIVNAANTDLKMGGGVCGAIFHGAGAEQMQLACDRLAPIRTGEAAITPGFALPAKYVVHAAGPVYGHWNAVESERLLRAAYLSSLTLAAEHGCESIAFPLISSGIYGYPKDEALRVATAAVEDFLTDHDMDVYLAVFDREAFAAGTELMGAVTSYIDEHYVETHAYRRAGLFHRKQRRLEAADRPELLNAPMLLQEAEKLETYHAPPLCDAAPACALRPSDRLDELIGNLDEPFADTLLRLVDRSGRTDAEVYKRANLDRRLFSKIRTGKGYTPGKRTILALAVSLELTLAETEDLLKRAGLALSHSQKFDVIVEYFIVNRRFNIFEINEVLFQFDQPLLGG